MRAGIIVNVTRADRRRLEAIGADRAAPQKHVWPADIILATADGCGTAEIMGRSGKSKPVVWTWQARFSRPVPCSGFSTWRSGRRREKQPIRPARCWRRQRVSGCVRCEASPGWFGLYPFRMLPQQRTDEFVLCVDEESELAVERGTGEQFFDAEGSLSPALIPVFDALMVGGTQPHTGLAVAALAQARVIRPWQINGRFGSDHAPGNEVGP
jgi:hypothetical protein